MKKILLILFLSISAFSNADNQFNTIKTIIDSIGRKYAPDKRIAIFDIQIVDVKNTLVLKGVTNIPEAYKELLLKIHEQNLSVIEKIRLLPDKDMEGKIYGVINVSVADIRVKGAFDTEMATQGSLGMPIKILQADRWYRIQTPDTYIGWTQQSSFQPMTKDEFNHWIEAKKVIFTDYYGFSYQNEDLDGQTVSDLVNGNILRLEGDTGQFYKVSYPDGRRAYVLKRQSMLYDQWLTSHELSGDSFVKKAFTLMGIPYSWGGTSVKAMDCSGLTKTVLAMHGIILMRDASQQAYTGTPIDISRGYDNLKPGDLMFFGKKAEADKKERIRHVAFYIGNKSFIHASGMVRVSSLDPDAPNYDEQNTKEFIKATRIAGAVDTKGIWLMNKNVMYLPQP